MEKKKIFLLETNVEEQNRMEFDYNTNYSLGLAYLSAVLKKEGYNVLVKDYAQFNEKECFEQVKKILEEFNPDLLGISMMSMTRVSSYKIIKFAKELNKSLKIIVGGVHSTVMYEQLLNNFPIDCAVLGEGENTLIELLPKLFENKSLKKVKGIAYLDKGKLITTEKRELISDLDALPFPDHGSFINKNRTRVCLLSSRGCPYKCSFCCLHAISLRKYRVRSPNSVVDEIEHVLSSYPQIKEFEFSDDTLTLSNERVIEFCKEIIRRGIKTNFICSARIKPISEELLYHMQKAGFKEIRFGIETGSRKLLASIHKSITPEDVLDTFKKCANFPKIRFVKFLMVGFPGEDSSTINETIDLTKKMHKLVPMDFFAAAPLWVYPGTEVCDLMKSAGKLDDSFWLTDAQCPYFTLEYTKEQLFEMSNKISLFSSLDRGYFFFISFIIKKVMKNPSYQLKRAVQKKFFIPALFTKITNR